MQISGGWVCGGGIECGSGEGIKLLGVGLSQNSGFHWGTKLTGKIYVKTKQIQTRWRETLMGEYLDQTLCWRLGILNPFN